MQVCHLSFAQLGEGRGHGASQPPRREACLLHARLLLEEAESGDGDLTLFTRCVQGVGNAVEYVSASVGSRGVGSK